MQHQAFLLGVDSWHMTQQRPDPEKLAGTLAGAAVRIVDAMEATLARQGVTLQEAARLAEQQEAKQRELERQHERASARLARRWQRY